MGIFPTMHREITYSSLRFRMFHIAVIRRTDKAELESLLLRGSYKKFAELGLTATEHIQIRIAAYPWHTPTVSKLPEIPG